MDSLVGESECLLQLIARLPRLAGSDATCLISGETGTGKELFARAIHYISKRRSKPFVAANCGAVPDHLFENELFGHVRGAYTDASHAEVGLVALAEQGTLFLDEVDTLSPSAQVKLLRFLQDHEYRPLGSSCTIRADVRIVAATNAELRQSVEQRMFREDLFHRLNVLNLEIPPLRERVGDIPILANYFVVKYASQYGRDVVGLTSSAIAGLLNYRWPGNVRELEGVIQRAVILSSSRFLESVNLEIPVPTEPQSYSETTFQSAKQRAIHKFESEYLSTLLATHDGNVSRAAKAAGKERRSFQRLLQKHSMERVNFVKKPA
ncbi:MAG TPA: sigma 54-interacting transcriptional regulator [Bryobacteraceae bacterium]|nr:sigma 54-interacting transcriptional regulator [Bryobacteraceae bacterium]